MAVVSASPSGRKEHTYDWDEALVSRYAHSGPRYTSYPTALDFTEEFGPSHFSEALERSNDEARPLSLYVHVPFCRKICFYCGCNKIAAKEPSQAEPYLGHLEREMTLAARHLDKSCMLILDYPKHLIGTMPSRSTLVRPMF